MARVEMDPGWEAEVRASWHELGETRLGPDIATDAKRYCPVDTGALQDSIESHMEEDDVVVSATGGADGRVYAVYLRRTWAPRISPLNWRHGTRGNAGRTIFEASAIPGARRVGAARG